MHERSGNAKNTLLVDFITGGFQNTQKSTLWVRMRPNSAVISTKWHIDELSCSCTIGKSGLSFVDTKGFVLSGLLGRFLTLFAYLSWSEWTEVTFSSSMIPPFMFTTQEWIEGGLDKSEEQLKLQHKYIREVSCALTKFFQAAVGSNDHSSEP